MEDVTYDRFGFPIDPSVGYARGRILTSTLDDSRRMAHAWERTAARVRSKGPQAFSILTGNAGAFPLAPADLGLCNEWTAPGIAGGRLRELALDHLGGAPDDGFVLLSRTSATILAWLALYGKDRTVLSVVPPHGHGHSSIHFAAKSAGAKVIEVDAEDVDEAFLQTWSPACAVITAVTSSMEELTDTEIARVAQLLRSAGCLSLLDDAYGARIRPVFHGQQRSLQTGVDVAVTNGDKVGLGGPRSALVAGRPDLIDAMGVWAAEAGTDARGPIIVGVLRALETFTPEQLLQDAADGAELGHELIQQLGGKYVTQGPLGPKITEEDALELALYRSGGANPHQVRPSEITAAIGLHVLERGIVTVNSHGQPGARVSLRLKPTTGCLDQAGGAQAVAKAFAKAFSWTSDNLHRPDKLRAIILGD